MSHFAYFQLGSGASGDMLLGAVLDVLSEVKVENVTDPQIRALPLFSEQKTLLELWLSTMSGLLSLEASAAVRLDRAKRGGMAGLDVEFLLHDEFADAYQGTQKCRHLPDIHTILFEHLDDRRIQPLAVADLAYEIFTTIGRAEAKVHGIPMEKVHFHEVGAFDSIMDIGGFALAWRILERQFRLKEVVSSEVSTGSGMVQTQHGLLSVPAPAVAELLCERRIPLSGFSIEGERLTPTGAGILAEITTKWGGGLPAGRVVQRGTGLGRKDFSDAPNVVQLMLLHAG